MKSYFNLPNFYYLVFVFLYVLLINSMLIKDALRGILSSDPIIGIYANIGLFVVLSFYMLTNRTQFTINSVPSTLRLFFIVVYISFIISTIFSTPESSAPYITLLLPIMVCCFFYSSILHSYNSDAFFVLLAIGSLFLVYSFFDYLEIRLILGANDNQFNSSYYILYLLPIFLCATKKIVRYIALFITLFVIVASAKRGGFIAFILALFFYFFVEYIFVYRNKNLFLKISVLLFVVGVLAFWGINHISNYDITVINRLTETIDNSDDEARIQVWDKTIDLISNSDLMRLVIGHGFNAVERDSPYHLSAHNDFLEVMYNYGIVAFIMYVILHVKLFFSCMRLINSKSIYAGALAFSYVVFVINSMVSHILTYTFNAITFAMVWAVIFALNQKNKNNDIYNL